MRASFTFVHPLRVRWAEVDRQDVVFNAHYFTYFDVAVTEYWRAVGMDYPRAFVALGTDLFARKASAEFHAPAGYDDVLEIGCRAALLRDFPADMGLAPIGGWRAGSPSPPAAAPHAPAGTGTVVHLGVVYLIFGLTYMVYGTFIVTSMVAERGMPVAAAASPASSATEHQRPERM